MGGVSSNPYFRRMSLAFSNESNTPTRLIPRNLATSAAGWPISSTASQATRDLASEYRLCLFPEHINSGLSPNLPATISISSSMGRFGMYFFSNFISACCRVSLTKSPLPNILASPFPRPPSRASGESGRSRSSALRPRRPAASPPALLIRPPPRRSSRRPCLIPFLTNSRYLFVAALSVSPKWRRISSMVFSAKEVLWHGLHGPARLALRSIAGRLHGFGVSCCRSRRSGA